MSQPQRFNASTLKGGSTQCDIVLVPQVGIPTYICYLGLIPKRCKKTNSYCVDRHPYYCPGALVTASSTDILYICIIDGVCLVPSQSFQDRLEGPLLGPSMCRQ